jgi:chromosomal replication initiation ATPase DnaA
MAYNFAGSRIDDNDLLIARAGKNKYVYLTKEKVHKKEDYEDLVRDFYSYINDKSLRLSANSETSIKVAIRDNDVTLLTSNEKKIYDAFMQYSKNSNKHLYSNDLLQIMPYYQYKGKQTQRDVIYVSGASGAGKSHFISRYCMEFNDLFDKAPIYFISAKMLKDESDFDNVSNIKQIDIKDIDMLENLTSDGDSYKHFAHKSGYSLVIFDDAEALSKTQQKYVDNIMDSVLQVGRSKGIYVIISKHILLNGIKSKVIINECTKIVLFTNTLSHYNITYFCKTYLGFDKNEIHTVLTTPSRYCVINKQVPKFLLFEHDIILN